jgi:hypothetical protein
MIRLKANDPESDLEVAWTTSRASQSRRYEFWWELHWRFRDSVSCEDIYLATLRSWPVHGHHQPSTIGRRWYMGSTRVKADEATSRGREPGDHSTSRRRFAWEPLWWTVESWACAENVVECVTRDISVGIQIMMRWTWRKPLLDNTMLFQ